MSAPRPSSFVGGPFLVNVLHRLPIPLVDAIFNNPSTFNDTLSPPVLFNVGIATLTRVVTTILLESFPNLPVEALNHLVSKSTSSSFLADIVSCWGLRWRALELSAPAPEREEEVFVRIVGGIQLHKDGDSHVHQYLGVVMGDPVRELKVQQETNGTDDVRSLFVKRQLQAPPLPPPAPLPAPASPNPVSADDAMDDRDDDGPDAPSFVVNQSFPQANPQHLEDILARLSPSTLRTLFNDPSVDDSDNFRTLLSGAQEKDLVLNQAVRTMVVELWPEHSTLPTESVPQILANQITSKSNLLPFVVPWSLAGRTRQSRGPDLSLSTLRSVVHALVQAISTDLGIEEAIAWTPASFASLVIHLLPRLLKSPSPTSPSTSPSRKRLSDLATLLRLLSPRYETLVKGQGSQPRWKVRVFVGDFSSEGEGRDRDDAKSAAALSLLESGTLKADLGETSSTGEEGSQAPVSTSSLVLPRNTEPDFALLRSILDRLPPTLVETIFTHRSFDAEDNFDNLNMYTPSSLEKSLENIIQRRYPELSASDKSALLSQSTQPSTLGQISSEWSFTSRILTFEAVEIDTHAGVVEALVDAIRISLGWIDAIAWCESAFLLVLSAYKDELIRSLTPKLSHLHNLAKERNIALIWKELPSTSGFLGKVFVVQVQVGTSSAVGRGSTLEIAKEAAGNSLLDSGKLDKDDVAGSDLIASAPASAPPKLRRSESLVDSLFGEEDPSELNEESNADGPSTSELAAPAEVKKKKSKKVSSDVAFVPDPQPLPPPSPTTTSSAATTSTSRNPSVALQVEPQKKKKKKISSLLVAKPQPSPNIDQPTRPSLPPPTKPKPKSTLTTSSTPSRSPQEDSKNRLLSLASRLGLPVPSFESRTRVDTSGRDAFVEKVVVGELSERGTGWTKQAAQQKACRKMLQSGKLGGMDELSEYVF